MSNTVKSLTGALAGLALSTSAVFANENQEDYERSQIDATAGSASFAVIKSWQGGMLRTPINSLRDCFDLAHDQYATVSCQDENNSLIVTFLACENLADNPVRRTYCRIERPEDFSPN